MGHCNECHAGVAVLVHHSRVAQPSHCETHHHKQCSHCNPAGRRQAAQALADLGLEVRVIPNMSDLVSGRVRISELRRVTVEELLGRDPVRPLPDLMSKTTHGKSVMVTGAGGSTGSELCRQILEQGPSKLVLFENSEFALYSILEELQSALALLEVALRAEDAAQALAIFRGMPIEYSYTRK